MSGLLGQVLRAFRFQKLDQLRLHILVVIRDVEHGDAFSGEGVGEFPIEAIAVRFFHHQNDVGPFELLVAKRYLGVVVEAGGIDFDAAVAGEHGLCGRAAQFVL